jgi:hypothetical protein
MAFGQMVFGQMVFPSNGLSVKNFQWNDFSESDPEPLADKKNQSRPLKFSKVRFFAQKKVIRNFFLDSFCDKCSHLAHAKWCF